MFFTVSLPFHFTRETTNCGEINQIGSVFGVLINVAFARALNMLIDRGDYEMIDGWFNNVRMFDVAGSLESIILSLMDVEDARGSRPIEKDVA